MIELESPVSASLAGGFFTTEPPGTPLRGNMTFPRSTCLNSKYKRKSAFREIREWGISVSNAEEIRLVPLSHDFPPAFVSRVCVCPVISKQANFLLQSHTGSDVWAEKTNGVKSH